MNSELGEEFINVFEVAPLVYKSNEELGVECEQVCRIDTSTLFICLAGPEDGRLLQIEAAVKVALRCKRSLAAFTDAIACGVNPPGVSIDNVGAAGTECFCHGIQRSRNIKVVGI